MNVTKLSEQIYITPIGDLRVTDNDESPQTLQREFSKSTAAGLTFLASDKCDEDLSPSAMFWRDFSRKYFRSLCRQPLPTEGTWNAPQRPDPETLSDLIDSAPPMHGLEYLCIETLTSIWIQLDKFTFEKSKQRKGGLKNYLHSVHSDFNVVGRVTFHLAENKKDPKRPFAFLATYTQSSANGSSPGNVQHTPLSRALQRSIEENDTQQLDVLLQPVSKAAKSSDLIADLVESRKIFAPQSWSVETAFQFLQSIETIESSGVIVRVPNWWNSSKPPRPQVDVRVGSRPDSTLGEGALDLQVNVSIDGEPLTPKELDQIAQARQGLTLLRGKWIQVDQTQLQSAFDHWRELQQEHVDGISFLEGMRLLAGVSAHEDVASEDIQRWSRVQPGEQLQKTLDQLRNPDGNIRCDVEKGLNAKLRHYQSDGARWLWLTFHLGIGVCLADDMGLGKTIQVIALLLRIKQETAKKNRRPALLIVPTSLLGNWIREIEKFAPSLKAIVLHRSMVDVKMIDEISSDPKRNLKEYDVVITSYGLARREKWLADFRWRLVVLDEAQAIKNAAAAQTKSIKAIPCDGRIALTGTPVENHLGDLWSLFDFCSPGLLGTSSEFKKFASAKDPQALKRRLASLRNLIQPYVLRRLKTDPKVVPDLPEKTEMQINCGLTQLQATLYRAVTDDLESSLEIAEGMNRRGLVLAALMQLKQICNHPSLYLKELEFPKDQSAKLTELDRICRTLIDRQEKLLVFTQFQSMCKPLSEFLASVFRRNGLVLTGKTPSNRRSKLVEQFQNPNGPPFFVISVKAGGTGLNLTEASHVVHFDRWWNPAVEDQATDRAFRIGQKRNVIVHKFVCRGTLEERIDDMIRSKKQLSDDLFGDDGQVQLTEMSNDQLIEFISLDLKKAVDK